MSRYSKSSSISLKKSKLKDEDFCLDQKTSLVSLPSFVISPNINKRAFAEVAYKNPLFTHSRRELQSLIRNFEEL